MAKQNDAPAPLVPHDVDLRDFAFMPLDVQRLRDSDLASDETPEACWAAVLLWCAAWHQVPAASVPDNDQWLAKQCGYVAQGRVSPGWKRVRAGALRGWVLCDDGRLYHPVVAEKAREAWRSKLEQRWRTEAARVKKHNQRHGLLGSDAVRMLEFDEWITAGCPQGHMLAVPGDKPAMSTGTGEGRPENVPRETPSKGQGQGQGQGHKNPHSPLSDGPEDSPHPDAATAPPSNAPPPASEPSASGTTPIEVFRELRQLGIVDGHAMQEPLPTLLRGGATLAEFVDAGHEALRRRKPSMRYVLSIVSNKRVEAAAQLVEMASGAASSTERLPKHARFDLRNYTEGIGPDGQIL